MAVRWTPIQGPGRTSATLCGIIVFASLVLYTTFKASPSPKYRTVVEEQIAPNVILWSPPYALPNSAIEPLVYILDRLEAAGDDPVFVYCGSSECVDQVLALRRDHVYAELIDLWALLGNSPLASFIAHHPYYKVRLGRRYTSALDWAMLTAVWTRHSQPTVFNLRLIDHTAALTVTNRRLDAYSTPWLLVARKDPSGLGRWTPFIAGALRQEIFNIVPNFTHAISHKIPQIPDITRITGNWQESASAPSVVESLLEINDESSSGAKIAIIEMQPGHHPATESERFGVLTSEISVQGEKHSNALGPQMEAFAALQYFPFVTDVLVPSQLNELQVGLNETMVLFGTQSFANSTVAWPPNARVRFLMNSIAVEPPARTALENSKEILILNSPIGARDLATKQWLEDIEVDTFLAGWTSILLQNPFQRIDSPEPIELLLVDVPAESIPTHIDHERLKRAVRLDLDIPFHLENSTEALFDFAYANIFKLSIAKVTLTSNTQIASLASALGSVVVFVESSRGLDGKKPLLREPNLLYHWVSMDDPDSLADFNWENPPRNPGSDVRKRNRATMWDSLRKSRSVASSTRMFGNLPLEALGPDISGEIKWHLVQNSNRFNWRNIRTIESIYFHHPDMHVVVHSTREVAGMLRNDVAVFAEAGYRITVKEFDLRDALAKARRIFDESLVDSFATKLEQYAKGKYWFAHSSDLYRLLVMYFDGGIYTDTDIIIVKSFESFDNAVGIQEVFDDGFQQLNNAVYKFSKPHNRFLEACILEFLTNYNPDEWAQNGPSLVSRVYQRHPEFYCRSGSCEIQALPIEAFYPIYWDDLNHVCFERIHDTDKAHYTELIRNSSFAVHLNNHVTADHDTLERGTLCKELLNDYCVLCDRQF